jgi:hypothetical protein
MGRKGYEPLHRTIEFTDKGAAGLRKSTARAHSFEKLAAKAGVTVDAQYWTIGSILRSAHRERGG